MFIFLKTPTNSEIQNFEPQKMTRAYVCMKTPHTSVPFILVLLILGWILSIILSIIFLFTDNFDVVSQTANCDFLGVQAGWPEYRIVRKRFELATYWAKPRSTANILLWYWCMIHLAAGTPPICKRVWIFEQAGPKLINEWKGGLI